VLILPIKDRFGREITYLRIAINHICNFNCIYCHNEGEISEFSTHGLTPEQIRDVVSVAAHFGINKVKITGGEPLLRKDIVEIVKAINSVSGIKDISLVTNGSFLEQYAKPLKDAGLKRVNVSLSSPNQETYMRITRVKNPEIFHRVLRGIKKAKEVGLSPIKVNMVVLKDINEHQILDMIKLAKELNVILQLIELQEIPIGNEFYKKHHTKFDEIEKYLDANMERFEYRSMQHRKVVYLKDGTTVELVKPMHNSEFCKYCNKIRVTSTGEFKPCLMRYDNHVSFIQVFNNYNNPEKRIEELKKLFLEAVNRRRPFFM